MVSLRKALLVDDLCGGEATKRVVFGLGRTAYRIDLDDANAEAFECAIGPYLRTGSVVGQVRLAPGPKADRRRPADAAVVRDWAARNGIYVADTDSGRLPSDVVAAYNAWERAVTSGLLEQRHSRRGRGAIAPAPPQ